MENITKSYGILESLRLKNNLYLASSSSDYNYVWLRDSFYEVLPYLDKDTDHYQTTYQAILDIFRTYAWKISIHSIKKPETTHQYIHPRYTAAGLEVDAEWGNCQHDAAGAVLFGIALGEEHGKRIIRDAEDFAIIQDLVFYLETCQYWQDPDNGMWEEGREVHASSIGACVAGLRKVKEVFPETIVVSQSAIDKGVKALKDIFPRESESKPVDLAQLSLIFPYNVLDPDEAAYVIKRVESKLLRKNGVIRYEGDSYYFSQDDEDRSKPKEHYYGSEAEWTFGLPWLSLCHLQMGNFFDAVRYSRITEKKMVEGGKLPELYFAGTDDYNKNTPLGWSNALYILSREKYMDEFDGLGITPETKSESIFSKIMSKIR